MAKLSKEQLEKIKFINLHTYTHFSIPMGVGNVKAHIKRAAQVGHTGFAITDQYVMGGVLEAYKTLKDKDYLKKLDKEKFPLVIGCRLNVIDDLDSKDRVNKYFSITVYAQDSIGYKNLVSLCSIASREDHFYVRPRVSLAELLEHQEGLVVTSGDINGMIAQAILKETGQEEILMQIFKEHFQDRFFIEVHFHNLQAQWDKDSKTYKEQEIDPQKVVNLRLFELAKRYKVKCFLTQNVYMPKKTDKTLQDILIGNHPFGKDGWRLSHAYHTMSVEEMYEQVQKQSPYISNEQFLEFCENTQIIQDMCSNVKLSFTPKLPVIQYENALVNKEKEWDVAFEETKKIIKNPRLLNIFEVAEGDISLKTALKIMIRNKKMNFEDASIQDRLATELEVIQRNGVIQLVDYFLLLEDVTHFVRENGYLRGFGRGCLIGSSLVLTANRGFVRLDEVVAGDSVYTHTGSIKKVIKTFKYDVDEKTEKLLKLETQDSLGSIVLTKDHKVFGVQRKVLREGDHYKQLEPLVHSPSFIEASSLKEGDVVFMKSPSYEVFEPQDLDLGKGLEESQKHRLLQKEVVALKPFSKSDLTRFNRFVKWDEVSLWVLGRFIACGWIEFDANKKPEALAFGFEAGEREQIQKIQSYFQDLNMETTEKRYTKQGQIKLVVKNKIYAKAIRDLFPEHKQKDETKYLGNFKKLSKENLKALLSGLFSTADELQTSSTRLMMEVRESLMYLGVPSKIVEKKEVHRKNLDKPKSYVLKYKDLEVSQESHKNIQEDGYYVRVNKIEEVSNEAVYDLMIEDDPSYLTSNFTVHNSGAGSLVAYALDITDCDPLVFDLLFERFLTKERIGKYNFEVPGHPMSEVLKDKKKE